MAYTASKHAIVGLTRNTAWMYAQKGIRCNAICPGATRTHISESMPNDRIDPTGAQRLQPFMNLAPAYLEPDDIAALALFLASDSSSPRTSRATSTAPSSRQMAAGPLYERWRF